MARRAREHLGADLTFCVYDKYCNQVLAIDDDTAAAVLDNRIRIEFSPPPAGVLASAQARRPGAIERTLRRILVANSAIYHAFQRLLGRDFTREEILEIQAKVLWQTERDRLGLTPIDLDSDTVLISAGFDWDDKNLRALRTLKESRRFRYFAVVYDIIPILFPHFLVPEYVEKLTEYFDELRSLADRAFCISETTRQDWTRYCEEAGTKLAPADAFQLGSDLGASGRSRAVALPGSLGGKRYAVFVSTIEPRKNHRLLYQAWDDCVRQKLVDADRDRLVFVGRRGWATGDFLLELSLNPATRDSIVLLDHVDDAQLNVIYQHAAFVLFPSHYEGFGLPLAEALGHGRPCISSNAGALPEIGGDLVVRLNSKDTPGWTRAIAHYMTAERELADWAQRIATDYRPITWNQSAKTFFDLVKANAN